MKLKVLHVINSMTVGGAETLLAGSLAPGGLNEHTDNYLVYFNVGSCLLDIIDKNVNQYCFNYKGGIDVARLLKQLHNFIRINKIDIVHTHSPTADVYIRLVCPASIPVVHTMHTIYSMSIDVDVEPQRLIIPIQKLLCFRRKNYNVICLSDFAKNDFVEATHFKGNTFVLNNFIANNFFGDSAKKYESRNAVLKLISIGNLGQRKNFEYLLEVFTYLTDQEVYLDIYGYGDKTKYEKIINAKKLKVRMMGGSDNIKNVLKDYDVFISSTKCEGFGLAIFEAMASGLPVMQSDIAPLKGLFKENAIYFDLNNAEATANKIKSIVNGEIDINDLAENGRQHANKVVRRDVYINKLLGIYNDIL